MYYGSSRGRIAFWKWAPVTWQGMCYEDGANWGAAPQLERAVLATAIHVLSIVHLPIVHSLALALA